MEKLYVFILAGGSGERFWPLSRVQKPKHLLKLLTDKTLLEETFLRFQGLVPAERIFILTNAAQIEECRRALPSHPPEQFLAEPAKRDTAPAAALATALARSRDADAVCGLFPADASIGDPALFQKNLADAVEAASNEAALVTMGVPPSHAATGFGYLEVAPAADATMGSHGSAVRKVLRFVEKPDAPTAEHYTKSGNFLWNAGIFVWTTATFLHECERNAPELARFIQNFPGGDCAAYLGEHFPALPKTSVDYAIMEKARCVRCVPAEFSWDDVGTWTALPAHLGSDARGNTSRGPTAFVDSENNIVLSGGRTIALCGVRDLVIVETGDAVLVCHKDAVQNVKLLQPQLSEAVR